MRVVCTSKAALSSLGSGPVGALGGGEAAARRDQQRVVGTDPGPAQGGARAIQAMSAAGIVGTCSARTTIIRADS